jgi:hypothetical protein
MSNGKKDGYYAKVQIDKDTLIYAKVHLDRREQGFQQTCLEPIGRVLTGILVGEQCADGGFVLAVQEMGKYAERVGCFRLQALTTLCYKNNSWRSTSPHLNNWLKEMPKGRQRIRLG